MRGTAFLLNLLSIYKTAKNEKTNVSTIGLDIVEPYNIFSIIGINSGPVLNKTTNSIRLNFDNAKKKQNCVNAIKIERFPITFVSAKVGSFALNIKAVANIIIAGIIKRAISNTLIGTICSKYLARKPLNDKQTVERSINERGDIKLDTYGDCKMWSALSRIICC